MEPSERGKFAREHAKVSREKRRQYCDYDTNRATPLPSPPPGGQWQCQGRNGTGSVTAFARDDSAVSAVVASPSSSSSSYASAVEAIHPNVVTVDDRRRRGRRENCRRDRIYVTRRTFGADCTRSAYSLSRVPRAHSYLARSLALSTKMESTRDTRDTFWGHHPADDRSRARGGRNPRRSRRHFPGVEVPR